MNSKQQHHSILAIETAPSVGERSTGGPRTAGPPRSATTRTVQGGIRTRGGEGPAAPPNRIITFLEEWFDCCINRPLFLGVIAVAFSARKAQVVSVASTSSKKKIFSISTISLPMPTTTHNYTRQP